METKYPGGYRSKLASSTSTGVFVADFDIGNKQKSVEDATKSSGATSAKKVLAYLYLITYIFRNQSFCSEFFSQ